MEQIDITKITDLQLCQFVIRANAELQRAIQNVQMMQTEVSRREQELAKTTQKPKETTQKSDSTILDNVKPAEK